MTPRERLLAIGVGVVAGAFGLQYAVSSIRQSIASKQELVDSAEADLERAMLTEQAGMIAAEKLSKVRGKSLPSSLEVLKPQYRDWLVELGQQSGLAKIVVDDSRAMSFNVGRVVSGKNSKVEAYKPYDFILSGECRTDQLVDLLANYYDKDYLHSITNLSLTPAAGGKLVTVKLTSRVLSLNNAESRKKPPEGSSGRLAMSADEYKNIILNRNPFEPPNQAPKLATSKSQEIKLGDDWSLALEGTDPEQGKVQFELATDEVPPGLELRRGELRWKPTELGEYKVVVRAIDDGWPRQSSEERLTLKVVEPPKEEPKEEKPKFDIASQAFVTMMVSGRGGPQASIRSRTEGTTLDLTEGSDFELGDIKAKVVSINLREEFIELETDGQRWMLDWNTSVADAFKKSQVD